MKPAHDRLFCQATNRQGNPCKRPAGWGTNHAGEGRCKLHGGASTGAPGNQNAVTHGAYAKVIIENLTDEERAIYDQIPEDTDLLQEIKIQRLKLIRLLARRDIPESVRVKGLLLITEQIRKLTETNQKLTKDHAEEYADDGFMQSLQDATGDVWG